MSARAPDAAQLARLLDSLVATVEEDGVEALDRRLAEHDGSAAVPDADALLVLCAERLQHSPIHRRAMLERLGPAISRLSAGEDEGATLRALAVTAQLQLAERLYGEAATIIDLLAARAGTASEEEGGRLYSSGARLLKAQLDLEQGNVAESARALDALVSETDTELRTQAPQYELSARTLQVRAHSAAGAFDRLERALDGLEAVLPDPVPFTLYHRGVVAEARGRVGEAVACYRDACAAGADQETLVSAQVALARLLPNERAGRLTNAVALADGKDPTVISALARALLRLGALEQARQLAEHLRELDREGTLLVQADILCAAGPPDEARKRVDELLRLATERGLTGLHAQAHLFAARLGDGIEERGTHTQRALALATRCGDRITFARARVEQALLEVDRHDGAAALQTAAEALAIATTHHRPDLAAAAELAMGLAHKEQGSLEEAEQHLDRAMEAAQRLGLIGVASRVLFARGRPDEATTMLETAGFRTQ